MLKKTFILSGLFALSIGAKAQSDLYTTTRLGEPGADGFSLYLEDSKNNTIATAVVRPEKWKDQEITQYVARFKAGTEQVIYVSSVDSYFILQENGQRISIDYLSVEVQTEVKESIGGRFVKGLKGQIEKHSRKGSDSEVNVLVFRNSEGQFITMKTLDVVNGWNRRGDKWVYEVRYAAGNGALSGQIINAAELNKSDESFFRVSGQICPVLAVRDTADGENNGKFLTIVYGVFKNGNCFYYASESPFLKDREGGGRELTRREGRR